MNSDSDSDVGPSNRPGAAQNLANMASQFLGTGHSQAAQSIFIGQPGHSQYSDNSDYGLGALDPFALEESPGPSSSRGQHQPAVLNPTAESIYGFQSETLSDPDEPRPPTKTESKDALRSGAHPQEHQQQQPRQPEQQIQPQDTSWLAVYFVALLLTLGIWLWSLVFARAPYRLTQHSEEEAQGDTETQEAQSIFNILPMLTSFTLISIASSMGVMFLLSQAVRRMVWSLLVAGPVMLVCSAFWGWGMSFNSMANQGSETRWACFVSLLLAGFSARMIYTRIQKIDKTIQVIEVV